MSFLSFMNGGSSSSLVSAITLDEELLVLPGTGGCAGRRRSSGSRISPPSVLLSDMQNAAFDTTPSIPSRERSYDNIGDIPTATRISRFDMVCMGNSSPPLTSSASPLMVRPPVDDRFLPPVHSHPYHSITAATASQRFLSGSLPTENNIQSDGGCVLLNNQAGQIKSMFPLSKPIRRDVSGGYLHHQQVHQFHQGSANARNTNINWTFPIVNEMTITNPFLLSATKNAAAATTSSSLTATALLDRQRKASMLPVTKPVRTRSGCGGGPSGTESKWNDVGSHRDAPPSQLLAKGMQKQRYINIKNGPTVTGGPAPSDPSGSSGTGIIGTYNRKSKSRLLKEQEEGTTTETIHRFTERGETASSPTRSLRASPKRRYHHLLPRNAPENDDDETEYVDEEVPLNDVGELDRPRLSDSRKKKRSIMKTWSSTNTIHRTSMKSSSPSSTMNEHVLSNRYELHDRALKRLRRHSAPWIVRQQHGNGEGGRVAVHEEDRSKPIETFVDSFTKQTTEISLCKLLLVKEQQLKGMQPPSQQQDPYRVSDMQLSSLSRSISTVEYGDGQNRHTYEPILPLAMDVVPSTPNTRRKSSLLRFTPLPLLDPDDTGTDATATGTQPMQMMMVPPVLPQRKDSSNDLMGMVDDEDDDVDLDNHFDGSAVVHDEIAGIMAAIHRANAGISDDSKIGNKRNDAPPVYESPSYAKPFATTSPSPAPFNVATDGTMDHNDDGCADQTTKGLAALANICQPPRLPKRQETMESI